MASLVRLSADTADLPCPVKAAPALRLPTNSERKTPTEKMLIFSTIALPLIATISGATIWPTNGLHRRRKPSCVRASEYKRNSYAWDAANRLIKITYPGTSNFSTFSYDGFGRNVEIVETVSGSVTSTKQFVCFGNDKCESRNATGVITAQYFGNGETINGTTLYFTKDHLGSVREMTNVGGVIQDQRSYDPYGRVTQVQGTQQSDIQFAGYYLHVPSGLSLTRTRAYSPILRWLSRDRIEESAGLNLYAYVDNDPISMNDPTGFVKGKAVKDLTCPELAAEIVKTVGELIIRNRQMGQNINDLPAQDTHTGQFAAKQVYLLKLLAQYNWKNCDLPLPPNLGSGLRARRHNRIKIRIVTETSGTGYRPGSTV